MRDKMIFKNEGTPVIVEGNKPLLLTNSRNMYLIEQGRTAVFLTELKDYQAVGRRYFLFEASEGDLLFGITPIDTTEASYGLLISGWLGTSVIELERWKPYALINDADHRQVLLEKINKWVVDLWKGIKEPGLPEVALGIDNTEPISVRVDFDGKSQSLEKFESIVISKAVARTFAQLEAEKRQYEKQHLSDLEFMENALKELAAVNMKSKEIIPDVITDDPLLSACGIVGKAAKIKIKEPAKSMSGIPSRDPLGDIATVSQIKMRQVVLRGEWWNEDNGPLLAYMKDDERPVALIPISPAKYDLYDPSDKAKNLINKQLADKIKPFAVSFYKPFPNRKLNAKDLLIFGLESCWKRDLAMIIIMGILGGLLGMLIPIATGIVFDSIIPAGERGQLLQVGFFLVASALAVMLFQLTRSLAMLRLEGKIESSVQAAVWDRLIGLPVPFFKNYTSGELAMRAMGISQIRQTLSGVTVTTLISSIFSIFQFLLLFYYSWKLALVAVTLVMFALLLTLALGLIQIPLERKMVETMDKITGLILELINGVNKFRVAGAEKRAFYLWASEFGESAKIYMKKEKLANLLTAFNSMFPIISAMIIFFVLQHFEEINLDPGKFIAFNAAFIAFYTAMIAMSEALLATNNVIPLYQRSKPILESLPEHDEAKGAPGILTGDIEINHVSFRYKEDGPLILKDVSLDIKAGEYVGLVGPSGSGKSTLFRVLLGFEKPETGQVFYNEQDINNVDVRSVRKQLGVVLQNSKLMAGDVYSNIIGSNPGLTMSDAIEASKRAGLYDDLKEMPMGMHTVISEGGGTLSGGQRQRLLIARAIVNKPKIIFFDEATSALDNKTQDIVKESLDSLKATRVVIAHRLSTIMNCEKIVVLDQGKIIEIGTYDELMAKNGLFSELAKRQLA
ncbi:MAG: NHLP bacteriocin export ABC transporter permease/ATPase subunit [Clostridia bacterium]|nr:NHLP bacteriocin export ABC transporter permease/ATPase subunit [Clostridia bacterium]